MAWRLILEVFMITVYQTAYHFCASKACAPAFEASVELQDIS